MRIRALAPAAALGALLAAGALAGAAAAAPFSWEDRYGWRLAAAGPLDPRPAPDEPLPPTREAPPWISADAAVLIDGRSGRVLYARAAHERRDPASTTKIMTAVLALELGDADDIVRVSPRAAGTPGSAAGIAGGDRYRLADLLRGLMLSSGNDAATAIAEHFAGSVPAFAALMNDKARALGLRDTFYRNPHGLTAEGHVTSAYDLAQLARYALTLPEFAQLVRMRQAEMAGLDRYGRSVLMRLGNTNQLLLTYDWVTGVKTGTTSRAGNCLVASASRDGEDLIAVVLHSDDRWRDSLALLEWGFKEFRSERVARAGETVAYVPVNGGRARRVAALAAADLQVAVSDVEAAEVEVVVQVAPELTAPVRRGQTVGRLVVRSGATVLARVPLVAAADVGRRAFWSLIGGAMR